MASRLYNFLAHVYRGSHSIEFATTVVFAIAVIVVMVSPYNYRDKGNRFATSSTSLLSTNAFALRTISSFDLATCQPDVVDSVRASRERLSNYQSDLARINSTLNRIDLREQQLKAKLYRDKQRKRGTHYNPIGTAIIQPSQKYTKGRSAHSYLRHSKPIYTVPRSQPVFAVLPKLAGHNRLQSYQASIHADASLFFSRKASGESKSKVTASRKSSGQHVKSDVEGQAKREHQMQKFSVHVADLIEEKIDRKIDRLLQLQVDVAQCNTGNVCCVPMCLPVSTETEVEAISSIPTETESTSNDRAVVSEAADTQLTTVVEAETATVEAGEQGSSAVVEGVAVVSDALQTVESVAEVITEETDEITITEKCNTAPIETVDSATQTRLSSFAPLRRKGSRLTLVLEKNVVKEYANSQVSHEELASLTQRLSSPSSLEKAPRVDARQIVPLQTCLCDVSAGYEHTCAKKHRNWKHARLPPLAKRTYRPSPLAQAHDCSTTRGVSLSDDGPCAPKADRCLRQNDSSISLGVQMQAEDAFDNGRRKARFGFKTKDARGRLRKILFGV